MSIEIKPKPPKDPKYYGFYLDTIIHFAYLVIVYKCPINSISEALYESLIGIVTFILSLIASYAFYKKMETHLKNQNE